MNASRIAAPDRPGSLFKQPSPTRGRHKDFGRNPREKDEEHLAAIRELPCIICAKRPVEACHIRMSAPGKLNAGIGAKPDDRFTLPMCTEHHAEQHAIGERAFYERAGIAPLSAAEQLYHYSPNVPRMRAVLLVIRHFAARSS